MNALTVTRGISELQARWRGPAGLTPDDPADPGGQWHGPCPRCAKPKKLSACPGDFQPVVWSSHCPDHPDDAVYAALKYLVPTAPPPGRGKVKTADAAALVAELAALKDTVRRLVLNPNLTGQPKDLVLLEAIGMTTPDALDALGVTAKSNRSRTRMQARRALALSPGVVIKSDNSGRSKAGRGKKAALPAAVIKPDNRRVIKSDNHYSYESDQVTRENTGLTERDTLVLPPGGTDTPTQDTDTALGVLRDLLGAEVISTEPRSSPLPVSGTVDAWQLADEGPCHRCGTRTCVYGPNGNPMCADCRAVGLVSTTGR